MQRGLSAMTHLNKKKKKSQHRGRGFLSCFYKSPTSVSEEWVKTARKITSRCSGTAAGNLQAWGWTPAKLKVTKNVRLNYSSIRISICGICEAVNLRKGKDTLLLFPHRHTYLYIWHIWTACTIYFTTKEKEEETGYAPVRWSVQKIRKRLTCIFACLKRPPEEGSAASTPWHSRQCGCCVQDLAGCTLTDESIWGHCWRAACPAAPLLHRDPLHSSFWEALPFHCFVLFCFFLHSFTFFFLAPTHHLN